MTEREFIDALKDAFVERIHGGATSNDYESISFASHNAIVTSYFIGNTRFNLSESPSDLERHEIRLRVNLAYNTLHSAQYHLWRIIDIRINQIKNKYCEQA